MPTGYQIKNQEAAYFLTFQVVEWVDVFTRKDICSASLWLMFAGRDEARQLASDHVEIK